MTRGEAIQESYIRAFDVYGAAGEWLAAAPIILGLFVVLWWAASSDTPVADWPEWRIWPWIMAQLMLFAWVLIMPLMTWLKQPVY